MEDKTPVVYFNEKLNETTLNYPTYEEELLTSAKYTSICIRFTLSFLTSFKLISTY